jgi:hypothetical protein
VTNPGSAVSVVVLSLLCAWPAFAQASPPFDGAWRVTLSCPASADGQALAYSYEFSAQVRDGVLHGERGAAGEPGWLQLDGPIAADGAASLVAEGLTNIPNYALYNVRRGTHFKRAVAAHFDRGRGTGSWTTIRTCTFTFEKS